MRGAGTLVVDVLAMTALQRAVAPDVTARVFGVFWALILGAIALGALVAPPGRRASLGLEAAIVVLAVAPAAACRSPPIRRSASMDRAAAVRTALLAARVAVLEATGLFAAAPRPVLERLAAESSEIAASRRRGADPRGRRGRRAVRAARRHCGQCERPAGARLATLARRQLVRRAGPARGRPAHGDASARRSRASCCGSTATAFLDALTAAPLASTALEGARARYIAVRGHEPTFARRAGSAPRDRRRPARLVAGRRRRAARRAALRLAAVARPRRGRSATGAAPACASRSSTPASTPAIPSLAGPLERAVAVELGADGRATVGGGRRSATCRATARRARGSSAALAPACELTSVRVLGPDLTGGGDALVAGLRWAVREGHQVVNLSLSTTKARFADALRALADEAYFGGCLLVASAHNMPVDSWPWRFASGAVGRQPRAGRPARRSSTTRARRSSSTRAGWTSTSAWAGGTTIRASGNSFATPHMAGMAARVLGAHPGLRPFEVKTALHLSADQRREERR